MKKHNNSGMKSEPTSKRTKSRGPVQRDTKEVLAELVGKLKEKLDPKKVAATGRHWSSVAGGERKRLTSFSHANLYGNERDRDSENLIRGGRLRRSGRCRIPIDPSARTST